MNLTKQSFSDYQAHVETIQSEYLSKQKDYDWKCNSYQDSTEDIMTFIITNRFQTTKITYIPQAKIISTTTLYNKDIEIIKKLKEGL